MVRVAQAGSRHSQQRRWPRLAKALLEVLRGAHAAQSAADHDADARAQRLNLWRWGGRRRGANMKLGQAAAAVVLSRSLPR